MVCYQTPGDLDTRTREQYDAMLAGHDEQFVVGFRLNDSILKRSRTRLICTDRRLLSIKPSIGPQVTTDSFPLDTVTSVRFKDAVLTKLKIFVIDDLVLSQHVSSDDAREFVDALRAQIAVART